MLRVTELLIAIALMLAGGAIGLVSHLTLGLGRAEAAVVGLAAFTLLVLYYLAVARGRDRREIARQIADLSRGMADLARQLGQQEQWLAATEHRAQVALQKASALRESPVAVNTAVEPVVAPAEAASVREATAPPVVDNASPALVREAVGRGGIEVHLQPIVTLPQRTVFAYEALARLRSPTGDLLRPTEFLDAAASAGVLPEVDRVVTSTCVRVVRRLNSKDGDVAIFCNLAPATLSDRETFARLTDVMEANRALAPFVVFEFALAFWRSMGAHEQEALSILADVGFSFSLDHVLDLQLDPHELADRRCAYLKVPAALLLGQRAEAGGAKAAAEFPAALARAGIKLIAEKIEAEATVMDLIDLDVQLAQGTLFSAPRPLRAELMQDRGGPGAQAPAKAKRRTK